MDGAYAQGVTAALPICRRPMTLEEAMARAEENLLATARDAVRLLLAGRPCAPQNDN